jgi:hypothetical protein
MKKTIRENMLLFSKERINNPNRYRLYFTTLKSLGDETPRVFRLLVRTPFSFNKFEIGRVYTLVYNKVHISEFKPGEMFNLQESHFTTLMETRDIKFMDKKTSAALRSIESGRSSKDRYYSFEETREIINYTPDLGSRFAIGIFTFLLSGVAFLIPFLMYAYMLFLLIRGQLNLIGYSSKALVLPILGIGALPVTVFIMSVLFMLSELALMRIEFTKWSVLKRYTLAWGGMRKSIFMEISDFKYLKKFGIVAASVLVVAVVVALIL